MRILIIGNGAREYSLGYFIKKNNNDCEIFFCPGNGGTESLGKNLDIVSYNEIVEWAKENRIDLSIVGSESYLADGIVDLFKKHSMLVLGPTQKAAKLESSKIYSKEFMKRHRIPTSPFKVFSDLKKSISYLAKCKFPLVIKADGLAAGKGAFIIKDIAHGLSVLNDLLSEKKLGDSGVKIVIEDYLEGEEVSILVLCNSKSYVTLLPSQDHKQAKEGDLGLNTGGMGAYAPYPLSDNEMLFIKERIIEPTLNGMREEGSDFSGVLYCGLMLTSSGIKVIEYNVRFGDPEIQVILPLLESNLLDLLYRTATDKELPNELKWKDKKSLGIVIASNGYPDEYKKNIILPELNEIEDGYWVHAGTRKAGNAFVSNGGRVINRVVWKDSFSEARDVILSDLREEGWERFFHRRDIGYRVLRKEGNPILIAIIAGSKSDHKKLDDLFKVLNHFKQSYIFRTISAHRQPDQLGEFLVACEKLDVKVLIAAAGLAAHLPGVIASKTLKPVIGVPLEAGSLSGVDALHSICQMPPGVPVATVGIDNVRNAAFLALQILALDDNVLKENLINYRQKWKEQNA
ncbi:MAG: phosphoribosylamine--glycine ligase [Candidatus Coatesbacteria bacterium]|nr:phosphoribosylamine--glycine ligase [Candidatus Coatesbacteria bacterium]